MTQYNRTCVRCPGLRLRARARMLFFRFELGVVVRDEGADHVRHLEDLEPLFLVERDREAPHAVERDRALLAHLQRYPARARLLERLVLGLQLSQLVDQGLVAHLGLAAGLVAGVGPLAGLTLMAARTPHTPLP